MIRPPDRHTLQTNGYADTHASKHTLTHSPTQANTHFHLHTAHPHAHHTHTRHTLTYTQTCTDAWLHPPPTHPRTGVCAGVMRAPIYGQHP